MNINVRAVCVSTGSHKNPWYYYGMNSSNKTSVKEEAQRLNQEFNKISATKKIDKELAMLIKSMLVLINILVAIFMEKKVNKNSKNSSQPPSQTIKDESTPSVSQTNGKGKAENNETASNTKTTVNTATIEVNQCDICGENLTNIKCEHTERRTQIDIIFEKTVNHVDAEIKQCPNCDSIVKGKFPDDMPGPFQYGNGIKAYVINLLIGQMISLNRAAKMVKSILSETISEATLLKFVWRLHEALDTWEQHAKEEILKSHAINVDETSFRVDKKNYWIHSYSAGDITLKYLHRRRGSEAMEDINIIPSYHGVIIHDCWSSYLSYTHCSHGLCGSHLTRELTAAIEANDYKWATNMKKLLLETCQNVSKSKSKKLSKIGYANLQKRYRNILTRGEQELPAIPKKINGKKGKIAKSKAHNLWERLKKHEKAVLLFAKEARVSFTNNRAERDLRMSKVKQKVSGCFRTEKYAKAYCRISSYLQTMANKGYNPLIAIQMVMHGKFV